MSSYIHQNFNLLYAFLKILVRLAMKIFARHVIINKPEFLKEQGPLLLACNHPNSFLDAVILDTLFDRPIWSLARGDVFKSRRIVRLLTALRILPVYRFSEGAQHLNGNYQTFDLCKQLFRQNKIVLIFSEGKCINEWHLRPLKKGTARLAISSWEEGIPVKVLPVGINYSSFRRFGKNILLNFGEVICEENFPMNISEGGKIQAFNAELDRQLRELVLEIAPSDLHKKKKLLEIPASLYTRLLLAIPAVIGWFIHLPIYLPARRFTLKKAAHNDHYDSILTAILLFTYPIYLLLIVLITYLITDNWIAWTLLLIFPFTAWSYTRIKGQL